MTNEEILKKAIEKAVRNGWKETFFSDYDAIDWHLFNRSLDYLKFIFSHDFARAFWGKDYMEAINENGSWEEIFPLIESWQYHLQQMVLEENPIKYLEKFL
jgi:hypothetical protein